MKRLDSIVLCSQLKHDNELQNQKPKKAMKKYFFV